MKTTLHQMQLFTHETAKYAGIESCSSEATSLSVREKLDRYGVDGLSDHELLILMLDGKKTRVSTASLASATLAVIDALAPNAIYRSLRSIKAVGSEKAAMLSAAIEFARRRIQPHPTKVRGPEDIAQLLSYLNTKEQEHFISISLNGAHEVKQVRVLTIGLVNSCQIHPREVLSPAITDRATSIVVAHNHPSGVTTPSDEDIRLTERLGDAADLIGIPLLDHLIFGHRGFLSFKSAGLPLRSAGNGR